MSIVHVFSFENVLLHITSIFNTVELINNIYILVKLPGLGQVPWQWDILV